MSIDSMEGKLVYLASDRFFEVCKRSSIDLSISACGAQWEGPWLALCWGEWRPTLNWVVGGGGL